MKEKILKLLQEEYPGVDFSSGILVDGNILDSLSIAGIVGLLSTEFGVAIPYEEITKDNFNSVGAMAGLVSRLMG